MAKRWTDADTEYLLGNAAHQTVVQIAVHLGTTPDVVSARASGLGIVMMEGSTPAREGSGKKRSAKKSSDVMQLTALCDDFGGDIRSPELGSFQKFKENVRCRTCNMVDGYLNDERNCKTCGGLLQAVDRVS